MIEGGIAMSETEKQEALLRAAEQAERQKAEDGTSYLEVAGDVALGALEIAGHIIMLPFHLCE
ncbi:hypothetical protein G6L37_01695 [Agrobacterium rubi]|nr:hypothetical protein [Agrobacterium rubi]NTF24107.1 hypothetical protein [Agrobacterium rubi]